MAITWQQELHRVCLLSSGASTSAPTPGWCRCRCRPATGTLPVTTASSPEIRSAAGTGGCAWKRRPGRRGKQRLFHAAALAENEAKLHRGSRFFTTSSASICLSRSLVFSPNATKCCMHLEEIRRSGEISLRYLTQR